MRNVASNKKLKIKNGSLVTKVDEPSTTLVNERGLVNGPPSNGTGTFSPRTRRPVRDDG